MKSNYSREMKHNFFINSKENEKNEFARIRSENSTIRRNEIAKVEKENKMKIQLYKKLSTRLDEIVNKTKTTIMYMDITEWCRTLVNVIYAYASRCSSVHEVWVKICCDFYTKNVSLMLIVETNQYEEMVSWEIVNALKFVPVFEVPINVCVRRKSNTEINGYKIYPI